MILHLTVYLNLISLILKDYFWICSSPTPMSVSLLIFSFGGGKYLENKSSKATCLWIFAVILLAGKWKLEDWLSAWVVMDSMLQVFLSRIYFIIAATKISVKRCILKNTYQQSDKAFKKPQKFAVERWNKIIRTRGSSRSVQLHQI